MQIVRVTKIIYHNGMMDNLCG